MFKRKMMCLQTMQFNKTTSLYCLEKAEIHPFLSVVKKLISGLVVTC